MKITRIDPLPNVLKFKNKEDFSNRIVQEVLEISKNSIVFSAVNKKILKLSNYEKSLKNKSQKLDQLIEKSKVLKTDLTNRIQEVAEHNNKFRDKLLEILNEKEEKNENN